MKKIIGMMVVVMVFIAIVISRTYAQEQKIAESFDGSKIAYTVSGDGAPVLVFIHGWSCDKSYWRNQVGVFDDTHKVIAIDLAGHGDSSQDRQDYTVHAFAGDVKAVLEQESVDRAILLGHSMGGTVVAEAARLMPGKIIALIGVDTLQDVGYHLPQEQMAEMVGGFQPDFKQGVANFVRTMFPETADPQLVEQIVSDMASAPPEVAMSAFTNYINLYHTDQITPIFEALDIPIFAVNARLWPTEEEANRQHMKSFDVTYVENAGHFLMMENPDAFNAALKEVLEKLK